MSFSSKPHKRKISGKALVVNIGCSCRRPKLGAAFRPKAKLKSSSQQHRKPDLHLSSSTYSSWDRSGGFSINDEDDNTTTTTTSFSQYLDITPPTYSEPEAEEAYFNTIKCSGAKAVQGLGRVEESVAVMKDSDDPYIDFKQSMLQMILEKELYAREDLRDLLDRFLQLNSPYHHGVIVRAFSEIWNGVFSSSSSVNKQRFSSSGSATHASTPLKPRFKSREL